MGVDGDMVCGGSPSDVWMECRASVACDRNCSDRTYAGIYSY